MSWFTTGRPSFARSKVPGQARRRPSVRLYGRRRTTASVRDVGSTPGPYLAHVEHRPAALASCSYRPGFWEAQPRRGVPPVHGLACHAERKGDVCLRHQCRGHDHIIPFSVGVMDLSFTPTKYRCPSDSCLMVWIPRAFIADVNCGTRSLISFVTSHHMLYVV